MRAASQGPIALYEHSLGDRFRCQALNQAWRWMLTMMYYQCKQVPAKAWSKSDTSEVAFHDILNCVTGMSMKFQPTSVT